MNENLHVRRRHRVLRENLCNPEHHPAGQITRISEQFTDRDLATDAIQQREIGKGSADIDAQGKAVCATFCHRRACSSQ